MQKEMTSKDVVDIYSKAEQAGIKIWIDGGWAVDALLGEELRPHKDLDIAVNLKDVSKLQEALEPHGYREIRRDSEWNFVLGNEAGNEIDIHVFVSDEQGNIIDGIMYPKESLTGEGVIAGQKVRCISAKYMIQFMAPYISQQGEKYTKSIAALRKKFGIT